MDRITSDVRQVKRPKRRVSSSESPPPAASERATLGTDDFAKIREKGSLFVDKSSFIHIFMKDANEVNVILRPRRFGKSLNLSMLRYFLSNSIDKAHSYDLFKGLEVTKQKEFCNEHMNKYPVVYLCLKECHARTWKSMKKRVSSKLAMAIGDYPSLLDSILGKSRRSDGEPLKDRIRKLSDEDLAEVLLLLMKKLFDSFGKRVVLLIDEYDAPLNSRMATEEDEMKRSAFFSYFYSDTLKSNPALFKACLVGVAEIRGSGILSGVNSLGIASLQDHVFDKCFGFTKDEAKTVLQNVFNVQESEAEEYWSQKFHGIREWYNGYIFGGQTLINPWSFLKYVYNGRKVDSYWLKTSATESLFNLINDDKHFAGKMIQALEHLLKEVSANSSEAHDGIIVIFNKLPVQRFDSELNIRTNITWSEDKVALHFLCMAGYLTYRDKSMDEGEVWIPNREIYEEWVKVVKQFAGFDTLHHIAAFYQGLFNALKTFNVAHIEKIVKEKVASIPRRSANHEYVYQSFVCGFLSVFSLRSLIKTGARDGFADSTLHFDDIQKSIIIEFKKAVVSKDLESMAKNALQQIITKRYYESTPTNHEILLLGCSITNENEVMIVSAVIRSGERRREDIKDITSRCAAPKGLPTSIVIKALS